MACFRDSFTAIGLFFTLCLTACGAGQKEILPRVGLAPERCTQSPELKMEDRLFFGADMPKGHVTPQAFQDFVDKIVTPEFPEGFSILNLEGQWKYKTGNLQKEHSWMIDLIYVPTETREQSIQKIIKSYKEMFHQEAVLRLHNPVCATFS